MVRYYLLLILLLLPIANADIIHDEWHRYRDSFEAGNVVYTLNTYRGDYETIRLSSNTYSTNIGVGECKQNMNLYFCYVNYTFDSDLVELDPHTNNFAPAIKLTIEELEGFEPGEFGISANVTFEMEYEEHPFLDNAYVFKTVIKNEGFDWAYGLRFQIIAPEDFDVSRGSFVRFGNLLYTPTIDVPPLSERTYTFEYTPIEAVKDSFEYIISYDDEEEIIIEGSKSVDSKKAYEFTYDLNPSNIDLKSSSVLSFKVKNLIDEPIKVDRVSLSYPTALDVSNLNNLELRRRGLLATSTSPIEEGSEKEFRVSFRSDRVGDFNIGGVVAFDINGRIFEEEITKDLGISATGVANRLSLNRKDVRPGSEIRLRHVITNNNQQETFDNFVINLRSSFYEENYTIERLIRGQSHEFERTIRVPDISTNEEFEIKASVSYDVTSTQNEHLDDAVKVKVYGEGDYFSVNHNFDRNNLERGEDVTVRVQVNNKLDDFFGNVELEDRMSGNANRVSGVSSEQYAFAGRQSRNVYVYRVAVPDDYVLPFLEVSTIVNIDSLNYGQIVSSRIPVNVPEDEVQEMQPAIPVEGDEEETQADDPSEGTEGSREIEVVKRDHTDNFLVRWITSFGEFIQGLL